MSKFTYSQKSTKFGISAVAMYSIPSIFLQLNPESISFVQGNKHGFRDLIVVYMVCM